MKPLSILSVIVVLYVCHVQGQSQCTTPTGGRGKCISLFNCPDMVTLVRKLDRTEDELNLLRESQCGYDDEFLPKVCCATLDDERDRRCFTPDGNVGTCIGIHSCPLLKNLLIEPVKNEDLTFIQNSRCEGSDQYSVCCGPQINTVVAAKKCKNDTRNAVAPADPRSECCGLDRSNGDRIMGGNETEIDQYPWLTIIEYRDVRDNRIKLKCGGALISSKYVLTAGHCVAGKVLKDSTPVNVRLGEYDTSSDKDCVKVEESGEDSCKDSIENSCEDCTEGVIIVPIETIIAHRDYNPDSLLRRHDIALLRLKDAAPYTEFIRPICLPTYDIGKTTNPQDLYVAGWGAVDETRGFSSVKLHVDVPYKTLNECQSSYEHAGKDVKLWNRQICAGGVEGKDSCTGDSGGPLMQYNGRLYFAVGIVSFGLSPCGIRNVPGVYTNVYEYLPWIRSQMKP